MMTSSTVLRRCEVRVDGEMVFFVVERSLTLLLALLSLQQQSREISFLEGELLARGAASSSSSSSSSTTTSPSSPPPPPPSSSKATSVDARPSTAGQAKAGGVGMRDGARRDGEEEEEQGKLGAATERLSNGKRNGLVGSRSAAEIK
eukprot:2197243-Rhodomonas_salina.1